jgi:hypothetical protein
MVLGSPDDMTTAAFAKLLATANLSGTDWRTALTTRLTVAGQQAPADTPVRKGPLVIKHIDDGTLTATFQSAASQLLGQQLAPDQLQNMIGAFHALETTNATTAYNEGDPNQTGILYGGLGGDTNVTPDAKQFANTQIQAQNPGQYAAGSFGANVMSALNSLRSSGNLPTSGGTVNPSIASG